VYRRFGTSKRFSEFEKKEISELIAIKLQIADDEWHQETAKLMERLDAAERLVKLSERTALTVEGNLRDFVHEHEKQLVIRQQDKIR